MRPIACGMMAAACMTLAGNIGMDCCGQSHPVSRAPANSSVLVGSIPAQWAGWFHWRCWDEAQRVMLDLAVPATAAAGKLAVPGRERYEVNGHWHAVPVRITIDLDALTLTLEEAEAERNDGAEAPITGPFVGSLSEDGRRIRPPRVASRGCEPEMVLDAAIELPSDEPLVPVAANEVARTTWLSAPRAK